MQIVILKFFTILYIILLLHL